MADGEFATVERARPDFAPQRAFHDVADGHLLLHLHLRRGRSVRDREGPGKVKGGCQRRGAPHRDPLTRPTGKLMSLAGCAASLDENLGRQSSSQDGAHCREQRVGLDIATHAHTKIRANLRRVEPSHQDAALTKAPHPL